MTADPARNDAARSVSLEFPARAEYVVLARLAMAGLGRTARIDDETVADLKLALSEAVNNAVLHAYPDEPGSVRITYELAPERVSIIVEDEGRGFEPTQLPKLSRTELREDSMGMTIVAAVVDSVTIERRADAPGMRLRFEKALGTGRADPLG